MTEKVSEMKPNCSNCPNAQNLGDDETPAMYCAEAVRRFQLQYLNDIPTNLIVAELCKREGVQEVRVNPYDDLEYEMVAAKKRIPRRGPARILVVID